MFKPIIRSLLPILLAAACGDEGTGPLTRTVTITGAVGNGTVSSSPAGIDCGLTGAATSGTCSAAFAAATPVVLTATPAAGYSFGGWLGPCVGSATDLGCTFAATIDYTVTPSFGVQGTQISGFAALVNSTQSAFIQAIVLGPAVLRRHPYAAAAVALANGSPLLPVTGTLRVLGTSQVIDLSGTFDSTTGSKSLVLVQNGFDINLQCGGGEEFWRIDGNLANGALEGQFCGTGSAAGLLKLTQSPSNAQISVLCGTFLGTEDFGETTTAGSWNLVLSGTTLEGVANSPTDDFLGLTGDLSGTAISLRSDDGDGTSFTAEGTLSADGTSMSGTWTEVLEGAQAQDAGTWQVSTAGCQ